jgi:hypothetical protein
MPTKKRVAKEKEEAELSRILKLPDNLKHLFEVERLGNKPAGGLIQTIGDDLFLHPNIGKRANDSKQEDRAEMALTLKKKYSDIWCKRAGAKVIAIDEGLSERTIQKYMKEFP